MDSFFVYTDGASRGNPGQAAGAYLIFDKNHKLILKNGAHLGIATNNEAEYKAAILALNKLLELKIKKAIFFLDSLLVEKQLSGKFKIKTDRMQKLYLEIKRLIFQNGLSVEFQYISRDQNKEADKLVNQILDKNIAKGEANKFNNG